MKERRVLKTKFLGGLALLVALSACPNIDTGEDGGGTGPITVGPEGGIFVRQGAVLDIPRNAVATTTTIVVTVIDTGIPEVPERKRISFGYRFSPSTLVFKSPIKIYLPWLSDRVPQAVDTATFDMRRQQGSDAYLPLGGLNVHADLTAVEAQTDKLGLFWITSPSKPNIARLEIDPEEAVLRVGETQQFTARVIDPTGAVIPVEVAFRVVPARVASITADGGLLTALDPGTATVHATAADQSVRATVHVQGTTPGPQTFVHENPFPTGNDLWSGMVLPAGLGVVYVGANGTVLHQQPSGWSRLFSTPGVVFKAVAGSAAGTAAVVGVQGTNGILIELAGSGTPKTVVLQNFDPRAMWFDGTHGMAVGYGNDVLARRNGAWVRDDSPSFETLLSVVGDGAGGFVTVGSRGSIYKWDPARKVWDSLYQTQLAVLLTAAHLTDATGTEAWAAGGSKLWHFSGGAWTAINMPATPVLTEVNAMGRADNRLVMTGRLNKEGWVFTYDFVGGPLPDAGVPDPDAGTADGGSGVDGGFTPTPGWTAFTVRAPQIPRGFFSAGPASTEAYVVGDLGAIYQYAGSGTFTELSSGFYGDVVDVKVALNGEVFAAANVCANSNCTAKTGTVYTRTGPGQWAQVGNQTFTEIFAMTVRTPTELMVATVPAMYRWDGISWTGVPVTGGLNVPMRAMKFCGNTLHGVGTGGNHWRGGATTLTLQSSVAVGIDQFGLDCPNENELWAAGTGSLASRTGSANWVARSTQGVNHAPYRAVWSPGQGEAYAFGDARFGAYWNTEEVQVIDAPGGLIPDVINGLWGSTVDNLYAVGSMTFPIQTGLALRFDGYQWRLVDSGSQRPVTSIDGASSTEIWLGTTSGGVLKSVAP
jgi:Bacterial Ig-like domain (group 2)